MAGRPHNLRVQLLKDLRNMKKALEAEIMYWEWHGRTRDNQYRRTLPVDFPENHPAMWRQTAAILDGIALRARHHADECRARANDAHI